MVANIVNYVLTQISANPRGMEIKRLLLMKLEAEIGNLRATIPEIDKTPPPEVREVF